MAALRAFIIFRDRVTYARKCMMALAGAGLDVILVDHGSTWPDALAWLAAMEDEGMLVLRRGGGHPHGLWTWEPFREACGDGRYIVTDPDVIPSDTCPPDWVDRLSDVLDRHRVPKAGLGLRLDRIPPHYQRRDQVLSWEEQFWNKPLDDDGTFDAVVDTTLALYRPLSERSGFTVDAARTGVPYVADHLAWYEDLENLTPELEHYHKHAEPGISYWTLTGKSVWGD